MHGSRALCQLYREQIDSGGTARNALGFFVGVIGAIIAHVGVSAFVVGTYAPGVLVDVPLREVGIAAAALGLATTVYGDVVRLPRSRLGSAVAKVGLALAVLAIAQFVAVYPGGWLLPGDAALPVALYVVGTGLLTVAESVIPLFTPPNGQPDASMAAD